MTCSTKMHTHTHTHTHTHVSTKRQSKRKKRTLNLQSDKYMRHNKVNALEIVLVRLLHLGESDTLARFTNPQQFLIISHNNISCSLVLSLYTLYFLQMTYLCVRLSQPFLLLVIFLKSLRFSAFFFFDLLLHCDQWKTITHLRQTLYSSLRFSCYTFVLGSVY